MRAHQWLKSICVLLLLITVSNSQQKEVTYTSLKKVIKKYLPQGGFAAKDSVVLTKEQAAALNNMYDAGYKKNKKIVINVLKNPDSTAACYIVRIKLIFYEFESLHDYALVFGADKTTLKRAEILQLNDEYAELLMKDDAFLKQFVNIKNPDSLRLGKNVDAVTEATISSDLTITAVKMAKYILGLVKS